MMAEGDIALVSTFGILDVGSTDERLSASIRDKMKAAREACLSSLSRARERGIRVGCGCDLNHASLTLEAQGLVAAGFTAMEAIQAATRLDAEICRAPEVGRSRQELWRIWLRSRAIRFRSSSVSTTSWSSSRGASWSSTSDPARRRCARASPWPASPRPEAP